MKRRWILPLIGYLFLAIILAPKAAIGTEVFAYHDFRHHHLPWRSWAAQKWARGEIPWWASGAANGFPLLAEGQGGFLYLPTMLLFLLLPDGLALDWSVLGHHVFAALGMWAFLSRSGLRGIAPFFGGLAFSFSGFLVSHALYLGMQNGVAWLPWLLLANSAKRGWLTALGVAALGLSGHPQAAAFSGLLVVLHAVATIERSDWPSWLGWAGLGALVASPQLAASLELSQFSMRDGGTDAAFGNIGAMPFQEMVGFILPLSFGFDRPADVSETYYHRGPGYWGQGVNSWETCVYVGVPVLVLAICGMRRSRFWTIAAILGATLMLGGPLWTILRHLPGFGYFRFPARFAIVVVPALSILAALGLDELRRRASVAAIRHALWYALAIFTLTTGVARLALHTRYAELSAILTGYFEAQVSDIPAPPDLTALQAALPPPEPENPALIPGKVAHILADLARSSDPRSSRVWWPALMFALVALNLRRPRLLTALVAVDLLRFGHDYHPTLPHSEVARPPAWLSDRMTEPGSWRTTVLDRRVPIGQDRNLLTASMGLPLGTSDVLIPSPLLMVRNEALLATAGLDVGDKGEVKVSRWKSHRDLSRRMAIRYVASVHPIVADGLIPLVRGAYSVYEDVSALPRVRVVPCVQVAEAGVFEALLLADPEKTVVIEGAGNSACADASGTAEFTEYSDDSVVISAVGPGELVVADSWYPGWVATLDGVETQIDRADLIYRGISLPAGEHVVTLRYRPAGLMILFVVSGLSAVLGLAAALRTVALAKRA